MEKTPTPKTKHPIFHARIIEEAGTLGTDIKRNTDLLNTGITQLLECGQKTVTVTHSEKEDYPNDIFAKTREILDRIHFQDPVPYQGKRLNISESQRDLQQARTRAGKSVLMRNGRSVRGLVTYGGGPTRNKDAE